MTGVIVGGVLVLATVLTIGVLALLALRAHGDTRVQLSVQETRRAAAAPAPLLEIPAGRPSIYDDSEPAARPVRSRRARSLPAGAPPVHVPSRRADRAPEWRGGIT
jgi:hypothetical protein